MREQAVEADGDPQGGDDVQDREDDEVAPVQQARPHLPAHDAEPDKGHDRDDGGDDAIASLVGDRLDVFWAWAWLGHARLAFVWVAPPAARGSLRPKAGGMRRRAATAPAPRSPAAAAPRRAAPYRPAAACPRSR